MKVFPAAFVPNFKAMHCTVYRRRKMRRWGWWKLFLSQDIFCFEKSWVFGGSCQCSSEETRTVRVQKQHLVGVPSGQNTSKASGLNAPQKSSHSWPATTNLQNIYRPHWHLFSKCVELYWDDEQHSSRGYSHIWYLEVENTRWSVHQKCEIV